MNATPRVALLPLVIIWLGIGILSKIGIIFLGCVFPLLINTRDGVKTTPAVRETIEQRDFAEAGRQIPVVAAVLNDEAKLVDSAAAALGGQ